MSSFTPSGVEFVAKNLSGYLSDLSRVDKAQQALGKSAASVGSQFAGAHTGVSSFASKIGSMIPGVGSLASALGNVATVAGGIVAAQVFNKIADGVLAFAHAGIEAVSHAQMMEASFTALLTQNNLYARTTETVSVATGNLAEMQAEAAQKSDDLAFKQRELTAEINTQNASIQEQKQRIIQMADGLDKTQQVARLQEMEIALEGMQRELAGTITEQGKLTHVTQQYETVTKTAWTQVMGLTEAQKLAKDQTKDLLTFVEKLAIVSPFEQEDVERVTQYALGAGLGVDITKKFTTAFLDWSAAVGINSANLDEAAYQLLQVKKAGTITAIDLRQLSSRGLDLAKVIGVEMGMSIEEFNAKAKESPEIFDDLIEAIVRYSNNTFAGTSQAMSQSIEGFKSTLSDLFTQSAKKVLRPLVDAVSPTISEMIARAAEFVSGGEAEKIGQALANTVMGAFSTVSEAIGKISGDFERFGVKGATRSIMGQLGFDQEAISQATAAIDTIITQIGRITTAFDRFGLSGAAFSIGAMLGLDSDTMIFIQDTLTSIIGTVTNFATQVGTALAGVGFEELKGALIGIGAVLAGGAVASLIVGIGVAIAGLLTPINLLIAGAALLGAAWVGNWGNIQGITTQAITTITELFTQFSAIWTANWPIIQAVALTAWEIIQGIFAGFQTALGPVLTQLQTQFGQIGNTLSQLGLDWSDVWNAIVTATGIVAAAIGAAILGIIGVVAGLATGIAEGLSTAIAVFQDFSGNVARMIDGIAEVLRGWVVIVNGLLQGDWAKAWDGALMVLEGVAVFWSNWLDGLATLLFGAVDVLLSTVGGFAEGIIDFFKGMYNELVGNSIVPDMINEIVKWFKGLPQKILNGLGDLASKISAPFEKVQETIHEVLNVDDWMTLGADLMAGLLEGITANADKVLEFLKNLAYDSLASLKGIWMSSSPSRAFADEAKNAMDGLVKGAVDNAKQVTQTFGNIGQDAVNSLMTGMKVTDSGFIHDFIDDLNMGGIGKAAGAGGGQWRNFRNILKNEISANMQGLADGSINFMDKITEVANRFQFPPNLAREFARVEGLVGHLTGTFAVMFQKLRIENLSASVGIANNFSSIGSGFADMLQSQMDAFNQATEATTKLKEEGAKLTGTATTQELQLAKLRTELSKLTTGAGANALSIEKLTEALAFGERQLEIYNRELALETPGSIKYDKIKLSIDKLTESMDMQQVQLEKLTAASDIDIISVQKKQEEIAKLTEEMEANSKAIQANQIAIEAARQKLMQSVGAEFMADATDAEKIAGELAKIQLLSEFLAGDQNQLTIASKLQTVYGEILVEQHLDRVEAQEELNKLTAEQTRREQEIIRQREAQAKLDALGQQINLIKMLSDRGLNPKDILGGITLGLQASTTDLLAATNRVVEAMVAQINADLQISSPSRVMARIGRRVVEGMAMGIERGQSLLDSAIQATPILNGSLMRPLAQPAYAGNTYNTYYEMPMTVHTTASAQATIRQYEVKRSMYAS